MLNALRCVGLLRVGSRLFAAKQQNVRLQHVCSLTGEIKADTIYLPKADYYIDG
jgi:hypothetical protein